MASQTSQPLIVLVVGASSGIGEATAKAFAARGHFFGAVRMAQIVLPYMREQKFGRLMFMSSTAGAIAIPFHAAYSASKGISFRLFHTQCSEP